MENIKKVKHLWLEGTDLHIVFYDGVHVLLSDAVIVAHSIRGELYNSDGCVVATVSDVTTAQSGE